jgi:hypothetical protein
MRHVVVTVQGLCCTFAKGTLEGDLMARTEVKKRVRGGVNNGRFKSVSVTEFIYSENSNDTITCGIGALLFLVKNNPFISVDFVSMSPERTSFREINIPPKLLESSKWLVNGKERWYFHEALKACRKNHNGAVRLPTGSGKTAIALTLAYNQVSQLGTGIIIVPSHTIKDQFIKSAIEFGIKITDYREWVESSDPEFINAFPEILISLPTVLHNDIVEVGKWFVQKSKKDMSPMAYKHQGIKWIIGDEVHHAACETWITIFLGLKNLTRSHGFSALPIESSSHLGINFSGMSIEDAMTISVVGPVIYEKSTKDLKDFLNIPILINLRYSWPKNRWAAQKTDDWHAIRAMVLKNKERIAFIAEVIRILIDREYNTITHVGEKEFGVELLGCVNNVKCVCWYGGKEVLSLNKEFTVENLREQAGADILSMICTSHAVEGLDLDTPLNAIVLIDGKKPRQILQKCGRITRPDRRPSVIINLMDHGLWILPRHSEERKANILEEFDSDVYDVDSLDQLNLTLNTIDRTSNETPTEHQRHYQATDRTRGLQSNSS